MKLDRERAETKGSESVLETERPIKKERTHLIVIRLASYLTRCICFNSTVPHMNAKLNGDSLEMLLFTYSFGSRGTRVQQCLFIYTNKTLYTLLFGSVVIFLYIQYNVCIPFDCVCELFRYFYSPCGFSSFIIGQNVVITHEINVFKHKQSNFSTIKNK